MKRLVALAASLVLSGSLFASCNGSINFVNNDDGNVIVENGGRKRNIQYSQTDYLSEMNFISKSNSQSGVATINANAKDGGSASLGPDVNVKKLDSAISVLTFGDNEPAYVQITLPDNHSYTLFETEFGLDFVDFKAKTNVTAKLYLDNVLTVVETQTGGSFQKLLSTKLNGEKVIKIDLYANSGACVTLGNPSFYINSTSGITKYIDNIKLGDWPAPLSRNYNFYGNNLKIGSKNIDEGFCVNSNASFDMYVDGSYNFFSCSCGIDEGVAGGALAGSVQIIIDVLDTKGKIISKTTSPVLKGADEPYSFTIDVKNANKLRFTINDGGDGIADDMAVIGNPKFSMSLLEGFVSLSSLTPIASNCGGSKTYGKNSDVNGDALSYTINSKTLNYNEGLGLYLVNRKYSEYESDKNDVNRFAYYRVNIEGMNANYFECLAMNRNSNGAYYEIFIDGNEVYKSGLIKSFKNGGYITKIACRIPSNSKVFEIRAIANLDNSNGEIEFVNGRFYKESASLNTSFIDNEHLSSTNPFPVSRDSLFDGSESKMIVKNEEVACFNSLGQFSGSSFRLNINNISGDTFNANVGLAKGYGEGKFAVEIIANLENGGVKKFTSPIIDSSNSGFSISFFYEDKATSFDISIINKGTIDSHVVWSNLNLGSTKLNPVQYLTDMEWSGSATGWGSIGINKSVIGDELNINGTIYPNGISLHAFSDQSKNAFVEVHFPAEYGYKYFETYIGVNKDTQNGGTNGSVVFIIELDGKEVFRSNMLRAKDGLQYVLLDVSGKSSLKIMINNGDGSYDCDWGDYISPRLVRSFDYLDPLISLSKPIDNQSIATEGTNVEVKGTAVGSSNDVTIKLNGKVVANVFADNMGLFDAQFPIEKSGQNLIEVEANGIKESRTIYVSKSEDEIVGDRKTISNLTSSVTITPSKSGLVISDLINENGMDYLGGEKSFIPLNSNVKIGGINGEEHSIEWVYQGVSIEKVDTFEEHINSLGEDYNGQTTYITYKYKDINEKFELESVWYTQEDFVSPIVHKFNIYNKSGSPVLMRYSDTLDVLLSKTDGSKMTNSYTYKSAINTTSYGYRIDDVNPNYHMNVFCTTDYNNGMAIDAGYIPWISLNESVDGDNFGIYFGIIWSDCRIEVTETSGKLYIEAGFEEDFSTIINDGDMLDMPAVFFSTYLGDVDDGSNEMKYWYSTFMMPDTNRTIDKFPTFDYSYWEILDMERRSWRMSDQKFYDATYEFYKAGLKEICIDTYWWKDVGDWRGAHQNWDSTLEYSSIFTNVLGLEFGTYMQAGNGLSTNEDALTSSGVHGNPNWFARGSALSWDEVCLADPDAFEYMCKYLPAMYMELGLDSMRTDFGYILGYCIKEGHDHIDSREDVGYWTSKRVYELFDLMKELFPAPIDANIGSEANWFRWEDCNCGGTLKDFMSLSYATRIQTTDAYSSDQVLRSYYDTSYCFPQIQNLLWFGDYMYDGTGPIPDNQFRFYTMLTGWACPITSMFSDMPENMQEEFLNTIRIYYSWCRDLVKFGNTYHIMPRYDFEHYTGNEIYDPNTGRGFVNVFKPNPNNTVNDPYFIKLKGLDTSKMYYVWSENNEVEFQKVSGKSLMENGILIDLVGSYRAEVIYFIACDAPNAEEVVKKPIISDLGFEVNDGILSVNYDGEAFEKIEITVLDSNNNEVGTIETNKETVDFANLEAGTYKINIVAFNKFGESKDELVVSLTIGEANTTSNGTISAFNKEIISYNDIYYCNAIKVTLDDTTFNEPVTKNIKIENVSGNYKAKIIMPILDENEVVKAVLKARLSTKYKTLETYTLDKDNNVINIDIEVPSDAQYLQLSLENLSPEIYYQKTMGYGRLGMYSNEKYDSYTFEVDVQTTHNGLNETFPRAGIMGAYVSDDCFSALYLEPYYTCFTIYQRTNGQATDSYERLYIDGFDYKASHTFKVVRNKSSIKYYVDGTLLVSRTFVESKSSVAMITEDAQGRFVTPSLNVGGTTQSIEWTRQNTLVNILNKTIYTTNIKSGSWSSLRPSIIFIG